MTDDELTKESFTRIANDFCDKWPKMSPLARWVNLVRLFNSIAEKARAAGYAEAVKDMGTVEGATAKGLDALRTAKAQGFTQGYKEAREEAAKLCEQQGLWKEVLPREIRAMKPEGEGK